jgi:hypothetical protein
MADNLTTTTTVATVPSGTTFRTDDLGAAGHVQYVKLLDGTDGGTAAIGGDATNGLDVDVTRLPALVAGSAIVGKVGIDQTTDGTTNLVAAKQSGTWNVGTVTAVTAVTAITNALPAGTNAIGKLAANSGVDIGDVDVTTVGAITPGTAAANLGKAEDAAHVSGDVGVMALAVRKDTAAALAGTDGDYIPLATNATGALRVTVDSDGAGDTFLAAGVQGVSDLTANTDLSVISAAGSGIRNYVTDIEVSAAAAAGNVKIYSGDPDSAGVLIAQIPFGANGCVKSFTTPRKGAANTAIFAEATQNCTISIGGFTSAAG